MTKLAYLTAGLLGSTSFLYSISLAAPLRLPERTALVFAIFLGLTLLALSLYQRRAHLATLLIGLLIPPALLWDARFPEFSDDFLESMAFVWPRRYREFREALRPKSFAIFDYGLLQRGEICEWNRAELYQRLGPGRRARTGAADGVAEFDEPCPAVAKYL